MSGGKFLRKDNFLSQGVKIIMTLKTIKQKTRKLQKVNKNKARETGIKCQEWNKDGKGEWKKGWMKERMNEWTWMIFRWMSNILKPLCNLIKKHTKKKKYHILVFTCDSHSFPPNSSSRISDHLYPHSKIYTFLSRCRRSNFA